MAVRMAWNASVPPIVGAPVPAARALRDISIFSGLSGADLAALARVSVVARYRKNQVLFVEGEAGQTLYFLRSGLVKVYRNAPDGREHILHLLGAGETLGLVPFVDGGPHPATAQVLEDAEIVLMRFSDFEGIARATPEILVQMLRLLAQRMRRAQEEVTSLSLKSVTARLARRLLELSDRHGQPVDDGIEIDLALSRKELGSLIGASRETATRLLHQFQREKVIRIDGTRITIVKPFILQSWTEL